MIIGGVLLLQAAPDGYFKRGGKQISVPGDIASAEGLVCSVAASQMLELLSAWALVSHCRGGDQEKCHRNLGPEW